MEHMQFAYEARENTLIIHMPREIDHHSCRSMKRDTELLLGENYINRIVFDFTHTEFMDSSGMGRPYMRTCPCPRLFPFRKLHFQVYMSLF